ncbi:MAG: hypothetical protein KDC98_04735 [Planctomycetes bacterium]|nr:hypothetical protein [Planctomycetota bacterium]
MNVFTRTSSLGLLATLAAITLPLASASAQLTIVRVNGGGAAPGTVAGGGNLTALFNAACDWWEEALITSPYTLTLTYRWGSQSGSTLAAHVLNAQGGTPNRETAGTITFDNDGSSSWFLDPTPCNPSEWSSFIEGTGNYGGGTMVDEARYSGPSGSASGRTDLFGVALHEIGHALGLSSANTAFVAERGDNDVDVTSPRPFPGSAIPLNSSSAHTAISTSLMWPSVSSGVRKIPSAADMLANAQISQMTGINYVSFAGCSRYIAGSSGSSGSGNSIPFGTVSPSSITTTFANNNGLGVGSAMFFDAIAGASSHVYLHAIALNTDVASGTPIQADIYLRTGTHVGNETSTAGWTLWTTAKGTSAGTGGQSLMRFNNGVYLASGLTHGVAVVSRDYDNNYTNGSNVYSNADITINTGRSQSIPFSSAPIPDRSINMRLYYQRDSGTWSNQKYQTILRCQELGGPGTITGLAFNSRGTGTHYNRWLRIRMTHKPAGYNLSTNFNTNISGYTTVLDEFDHSWEVNASGWNEIGLENGFAYNGNQDVVVEIYARGNHTSVGTVGTFNRDENINTPRAYAYGFPWSAEPATTADPGLIGGGRSNHGTKIRVEFECANVGDFGTSCTTAFADAVSTPVAGTSYTFHIHGGPPSSGAFAILGFSVTPQQQRELSTSGFNGCYAWIPTVATSFKPLSAAGFAAHTVSVPNTTAFDGTKIYCYWAALDSNAPGGLAITNYVRSVIGQSNP